MAAGPIAERNQDATIYVGGLDDKVTDALMWELFVQAGPVVNIHMPKDRVTQSHQGYGFVEFIGEDDADYAIKIMNMIKLYGKPIRVNKASAHQKNLDVGANVFIGNLDPEVDEKLLYDTFSAFGVILQTPKVMRDPETGNSKGFAFINYASFDASDAAIDSMNGQHLCNRPVSVSYAYKKDVKGERHGSAAERLLAAQNPLSQADRPHQLFADAPSATPSSQNGPTSMELMDLMATTPNALNLPPPPPPVPPPGLPGQLCMPPPPPPMGRQPPPFRDHYHPMMGRDHHMMGRDHHMMGRESPMMVRDHPMMGRDHPMMGREPPPMGRHLPPLMGRPPPPMGRQPPPLMGRHPPPPMDRQSPSPMLRQQSMPPNLPPPPPPGLMPPPHPPGTQAPLGWRPPLPPQHAPPPTLLPGWKPPLPQSPPSANEFD